jgi:DNA-binding PadR family transcriptional regulator
MSEPLKPAVFHVLLALADRDRHGYGLMQAVREQSRGRVPLQTGSFYRHLTKLLAAGWVAELAAPAGDDPRRGAYYRLTRRGRDRLLAEQERLLDLVAAMRHLRPLRKGTA